MSGIPQRPTSSEHRDVWHAYWTAQGDALAHRAAAEAILGMFIEITFIATFTQRFFTR